MNNFKYTPILPLGKDKTKYKKITEDFVKIKNIDGKIFTLLDLKGLTFLTERAFSDVSHLLRSEHLSQLKNILDDSEASSNDKFIALEMLKNAVISADKVLPMCQDTGTAIVIGKKGENVLSGGSDHEAISEGIFNTYQTHNLRFSQLAPLSMFEEKNTANNLPAQIDIYASEGNEYNLTFVQKGGGSANKTFLYQKSKAVLNKIELKKFLKEAILSLGTSACPPYHLAIVIGGTSAEYNLNTVKKASIRDLDNLPNSGSELGHGWRDLEWEKTILEMTRNFGIGAQFGGKYYCHDVRVIRLPRHGASCPIGIGVSCSADRQIKAKINPNGIFIEELEKNPERFLPTINYIKDKNVIEVDLNKGIENTRKLLDNYPVKTRLSLKGPLIVARDIAHSKIDEYIDINNSIPDYFKNFPIYYAGPAKTPTGMSSGSFGPTTAGRMDTYVDKFQSYGGSLIMLAKGNRSKEVVKSCKKYSGFYLGSIGGVAAKLAKESIKEVKLLEYPELGMEAIWKIYVENFPAFIVIDNKGNDFYNLS